MADDKAAPATAPAVPLDAEGKKLQLDAEKAKYLEAIAKSKQATAAAEAGELSTLLPSVSDAPKGEITLGEAAGAFGPWRAHQLIGLAAEAIAAEVIKKLPPALGGPGATPDANASDPAGAPRVLVVDDRTVLPGNWTAQYVRTTLERVTAAANGAIERIASAQTELSNAIQDYHDAEAPPIQAEELAAPPADEAAAADAAAAPATPGAAGALGAAVNLLGLLRTDYTITATAVTATATELSTLTAGKLADQVATEADAFTTTDADSPSMKAFADTADSRTNVVVALEKLIGALAPVAAEITSLEARITSAEQAWTKAVTDGKPYEVTAPLRASVDSLVEQQTRRQAAYGPADAVISYAKQVITDLDAAAAAVLKASPSGEAPLYTAIKRERLDAHIAARRIIHVVYVSLDSLAADAVTRRSILGTSDRMRFLSAGNASWLLLATATGKVAGGGQVSPADVLTFDIESGNAGSKPVTPLDSLNGSDLLRKVEWSAKILVLILLVVLAFFGVASALALLGVSFS